MNDPQRLSLTSESDVERTLLHAGRAGAPAGAKQRALLAASAALAATSLAARGASAGTTAAIVKAGSMAALKWVGILGLIGIGAAFVVVRAPHGRSDRTATALTAPAPLPVAQVQTTAPTTPAAPEPETNTAAVPNVTAPARLGARSGAKAVAAGVSNASTLPVELAMLDRARSAMSAGALPQALSILDAHAARFPHGAMAPEAAVLRVGALVRAGDRASATRFANAFLARDPRSPYAPRIQSLLATSN